MNNLDVEAEASASTVAAVGEKRDADSGAGGGEAKKIRTLENDPAQNVTVAPTPVIPTGPAVVKAPEATQPQEELKLQPFPFFFYRDLSREPDPDPLTPLTQPGRVPNFPAKMHAILSRPDLRDVICWMPHGRSWRVLKPREFEIRVIPTYFEHAKFSSFIRQANGWGFRRISQGRDRNSYYHEQFLRGLPHLCKNMKRPGVAQKEASDPDHEPDLEKISQLHPVPEKTDDDSILLECTVQGGPKARMPIYSGSLKAAPNNASHSMSGMNNDLERMIMPMMTSHHTTLASLPTAASQAHHQLTPRDEQSLAAFQRALGASETQMMNLSFSHQPGNHVQPNAGMLQQPTMFSSAQKQDSNGARPLSPESTRKMSALSLANQLAFADNNMPMSEFAAGFAAATALSQQQFQSMLGLPPMPMQQHPNQGSQQQQQQHRSFGGHPS